MGLSETCDRCFKPLMELLSGIPPSLKNGFFPKSIMDKPDETKDSPDLCEPDLCEEEDDMAKKKIDENTVWFILNCAYVDEELKKLESRRRNKVTLREVEITVPEEMTTYAFPECDKKTVLAALGMKDLFSQSGTNEEKVILLTPLTVETNWIYHSENESEFAEIAEEILLPAVRKNIVINVLHDETAEPEDDGKFHIFIFSSPEGSSYLSAPETIWGIDVDCQSDSFAPSGRGIAIAEDGGYEIAELVKGDNLYIHYALADEGTEDERMIFRRVCQETLGLINASLEKGKELEEKQAAESRERYVGLCANQIDTAVADAQKAIENSQSTIIECQGKIVKAVRTIDEKKRIVRALEESGLDKKAGFGKEFDALLKVKGIKRVLVANNKIQAYTEPMRIKYEGKTYDIGEFRIDINVGSGRVKCHNLTRDVGGMYHPHIGNDGDACFGSISDNIAQLHGDYQFSILVQLILQYLQTVNPNEAGSISAWPLAIETTPI